jgi:DNA-binding response OmpR family regulator
VADTGEGAEIYPEMVTGLRTTVLLVEDDAGIREALADLLDLLGARVVVAEDGEGAWALLDGGLFPTLVLLDLFLPRLDGLALLGRIRVDARLRSLTVVTMSAAVKECPPTADAHLEKPFDIERLVEVVRAHCRPEAAGRAWELPPAARPPLVSHRALDRRR